MKQRTFLDRYLYRFLCTSILTGIVAMSIAEYYHFTMPKIIIGILVVLSVCCISLFHEYRKTPIPYIILVVVVFIVFCVVMGHIDTIRDELNQWYHWLWQMAWNEETTVSDGVALLYTVLTLGVVNLSGVVFFYLVNQRTRRMVIAGGILISIQVCLILGYDPGKAAAALGFTFLFLCMIEVSFLLQYHADEKQTKGVVTYLTPFALVMLLICLLLPSSSEPMRFKAIRYVWNQIKECGAAIRYDFVHWFHSSDESSFELSFAGFTEDATLGKGINENNRCELHVYDRSFRETNLYLIGSIKNSYTGTGWVNTVQDSADIDTNYTLDVYELANALLHSYENLSVQEVAHSRTYSIEYEGDGTKIIFYPEHTAAVTGVHNVEEAVMEEDQLLFSKMPGYKGKYEVEGIEMRLGSESTDAFLIEHTKSPYQWDIIDSKTLTNEINYYLSYSEIHEMPNLSQALQQRAKKIYDNYLEVPEDISPEVKKLAEEITKGAESDYERLKRLEAYLNTYTYTTTPKQPEQREKLLEYFLFESKEGYCTYFATAMTIMSRCIGIPARYVQGYCAEAKKNVYEYDLTGNNAHAWSDAYLEGIGWISFEPTPGYSELRYRARELYQKSTVEQESPSLEPYSDEYYEKIANRVSDMELSLEDEEGHGITKGQSYLYVLLTILGVVLLILLLSFAYLFLRIAMKKRSYRSAGVKQRLYILLKRTLFLIKELDLCKNENPTVMEQIQSAACLDCMDDEMIHQVSVGYMNLCYGDANFSGDALVLAERMYDRLLLHTKEKKSPIAYALLQFRLVKLNG